MTEFLVYSAFPVPFDVDGKARPVTAQAAIVTADTEHDAMDAVLVEAMFAGVASVSVIATDGAVGFALTHTHQASPN